MTDHTVKKNPASIPHSIWHADDLRRAEKEAADSLGITLYELMLRAGEAAFDVARSAWPQDAHWLIGVSILLALIGTFGNACWALAGHLFQRVFRRYGRQLNIILALLLVYCAVRIFY